MADQVSTGNRGLHQDNSYDNQPENTLRYALNAVNKDSEGNYFEMSVEQANELAVAIPDDFNIVGKAYISENEIAVLLVSSDDGISEIGMFYPLERRYETFINDYTSHDRLNFKIENQINVVYRLRLGCEKTIYYTDGYNRVGYFNYSKPESFLYPSGQIDKTKFYLNKVPKKIPYFNSVTVGSSGLSLSPGSYTIAIQLLDEDLNPTDWLNETKPVIIFNDQYQDAFGTIRGSTNLKSDINDFGTTSKSIHLEIKGIDDSYPYYRLAIIKANNGSGLVNEVVYTDKYSTQQNNIVYTGGEDFVVGSLAEVNSINSTIETAKYIAQSENRLLLSGVKGKQVNWCELQKYASEIEADVIMKKVSLKDINVRDNQKRGEVLNEDTGYQPGEIYSFQISWVFEDGYESPLYHIPGKSPAFHTSKVFRGDTTGLVRGMSNDNLSADNLYLENPGCANYWGKDNAGHELVNTQVRHHRFPHRSEINAPMLEGDSTNENYTYILGIKFSNIVLPIEESVNSGKIVGYNLYRARREENDKTILDGGFMHRSLKKDKYTALGHLNPDPLGTGVLDTPADKKIYGLIHPEHKFLGKEYLGVKDYFIEGYFSVPYKASFFSETEDAMAGTSYRSEHTSAPDKDGFTLNTLLRTSRLKYETLSNPISLPAEKIKYLNAVSYTEETVGTEDKKVYNVSSDNKTGVLMFDEEQDIPHIPYVLLRRPILNPYNDYRTRKYFKENRSALGSESVDIFSGDSFVSSMRYTNSMFYDVRLASRSVEKGFWDYVIGGIAAIVGTVLIATGIGAGAGVLFVGYGASQIASGIKKDNIAQTYQEEYEKGLKDTVKDTLTESYFDPMPPDDEVRWFVDILSDVWIESQINMNWRHGTTIEVSDFLDSPKVLPLEIVSQDAISDPYGVVWDRNTMSNHILEKLSVLDDGQEAGRLYRGYAIAEMYEINKDYLIQPEHRIRYSLPAEYDCCTDCLEVFPQRTHYSEQSFQEEKTDNYRILLPNNYRDLAGESGDITNMFVFNNNIYLHTETALWMLPKSYQERVTDQVVTFIGTGGFFEVPPQKILDDSTGNSGGSQDSFGTVKTPHGVIFVSQRQKKVFSFDGQNLRSLSSKGLDTWFKNNLQSNMKIKYLKDLGEEYPYQNNPLNAYGTGFTSVYDSQNERVLITKQDGEFQTDFNPDNLFCVRNGQTMYIDDYKDKQNFLEAIGYIYKGLDFCNMKFQRIQKSSITNNVPIALQNDTDVIFHIARQNNDVRMSIPSFFNFRKMANDWANEQRVLNPSWTGKIFFHQTDNDNDFLSDGKYLRVLFDALSNQPSLRDSAGNHVGLVGQSNISKNIIQLSFVINIDSDAYTVGSTSNKSNTYVNDLTQHLFVKNNNLLNVGGTFKGYLFPLILKTFDTNNVHASSLEFMSHAVRAVEGGSNLSNAFIDNLKSIVNPGANNWNAVCDSIQNDSNTAGADYGVGLKNQDWDIIWSHYIEDDYTDLDSGVLNQVRYFFNHVYGFKQTFNTHIQPLLAPGTGTTQVKTYIVEKQGYDVQAIQRNTPIFDKSWTISTDFSEWVSWHSYKPKGYLATENKFFSFENPGGIYEHNILGKYQNFYGKREPFVIEFVSKMNQHLAGIWEHVEFYTKAYKYVPDIKDFKEERLVTFNRMLVYNSKQITGYVDLNVKDLHEDDYLLNSIQNVSEQAILDRNERNWSINELRDVRTDYDSAMFTKKTEDLIHESYLDKDINYDALDPEKPWYDCQPFRGKYLVVRLIFDNFEDVKLVFNHSVENINVSPR